MLPKSPHEKPGALSKAIRWLAFRLTEHVSNLRNPRPPLAIPDTPGGPRQSVWVFVSTIGELNGIATFLRPFAVSHPELQLVLISDHEHYRATYLSKFPEAVYVHTMSAPNDAHRLGLRFPPVFFILAEIPCLPSDAPCRLSYSFVRQAKKAGATVAMVNGWLYGYAPDCRMDHIERAWMTTDYLSSFDLLAVQTPQVREALISNGALPANTIVTGNMKFDALDSPEWKPENARSPAILGSIVDGTRPTLVVGCIRHQQEQSMVINAFVMLLDAHPNTLMVFAHRHPEFPENIQGVCGELKENNLNFVLRSQTGDTPPSAQTQCLVLDTMGELKDFYAASTICHVGADHNLLEPLTYRKPITTHAVWDKAFPNFPIFHQLREAGVVTPVTDHPPLTEAWQSWLTDPSAINKQQSHHKDLLTRSQGATTKTLAAISDRFPDFY